MIKYSVYQLHREIEKSEVLYVLLRKDPSPDESEAVGQAAKVLTHFDGVWRSLYHL